MPHIRAKSGRIFHDISSETAALFVEAGLYEYFTPAPCNTVSKPTPRPTVPTFVVGFNDVRGKFELVCSFPSGVVQRFDGAPHLAKDAFKCLAWSPSAQAQTLQGPEPSAAVLSEYSSAYGLPAAEANQYAMSKQRAEEVARAASGKLF